MAFADLLILIAADHAREEQDRASDLERQLEELETRKALLELQLKSAKQAGKRLAIYNPKTGIEYQCPSCWMARSMISFLRSIPSDSDMERRQCRLCAREFDDGR
jgi:hypothetical protein